MKILNNAFKPTRFTLLFTLVFVSLFSFISLAQQARNPIIFADVPDISVIRVGKMYYMSSTTMHMSPGLPIMKSTDMVNWKMASYAYDRLGESNELSLMEGKNAYGKGTWASSLRYNKGTFYVSTFSSTTGLTYIYSTKDVDKGNWKSASFKPALHDHSLFFDDDGKAYMVYGAGRIMIVQLNAALTGIEPNTKPEVLIENANLPAGANYSGLPAEGSQLFKIKGKYYLFNICWPRGGMRTVLVHRADQLKGKYEGQIGFQDKGVAQGGLIQMADESWYSYLFRDYGSVGRIPYLVPVTWKDAWPVIGVDKKTPDNLDLPKQKTVIPEIVASDEFNSKAKALPLVWQWNHNPDNKLWSLTQRPGYLRLTTGNIATDFLTAQNTLTQRTFGPNSTADISIDVSGMKDGDVAGLGLLQKKFAWIGVKMSDGKKVITTEGLGAPAANNQIPLSQGKVFLRVTCDFQDRKDQAKFHYSLNGSTWVALEGTLKMEYTIPHFMGYRFGLFNYSTKAAGGYVDFDYFRLGTNATDNNLSYKSVQTYINPVLPGDHPDPTLLKVGDDFYHCGSTFHFNPYLPIYHSKDLIHWEVIARVLPQGEAKWVSDKPSAGIWQGAITYFYGSYWIYFSAGGQWVSKASSPKGPWSKPVKVVSNPKTGDLGYDNSIFVDDNGKPYMVIKNGQKVNRLQELGADGQLKGEVMNMDWINAKLQYSWAEGPVMAKRNGFYYYFPAGDVSGGQYVLRGTELTADSSKWERLGNFFKPITDDKVGFRRPNHIAAPIMLNDGTWWTIGQSYEKYPSDDWSGMGRQTALYPVIWEGDRPWGMAPTTSPVIKPKLPQSGISWRSVKSDHFNSDSLSLDWHFLNKESATRYSLSGRKGWARLSPKDSLTHLLQKETDHFYTAVTKVDINAMNEKSGAGIYLSSGNQKVQVKLYSGYDNGKKILFKMGNQVRSVANTAGNILWLKLTREEHSLTGYYSADGKSWKPIGEPINSIDLDKGQPNFNSWVGTSLGLFAEGMPADFDLFICKDARSILPAVSYNNQFGLVKVSNNNTNVVTPSTSNGGWLMFSGIDLGLQAPKSVEIKAVAGSSGILEVWADDLQTGKLIAKIPYRASGKEMISFTTAIKSLKGQHDIFLKFPEGASNQLMISNIRFVD
jgi:xylan 1,4-beta-xylosidase